MLDRLEEIKIIEIYNYIRESKIAKIIKNDIHSSLNQNDIFGLKRPWLSAIVFHVYPIQY